MTIFLGKDGDGQGTEVGAASSTQRMPDNANQMTSAEHRAGNGTLLMHADYAYDVFGNRLAKSVRTGPFGTPVVTRFAYDDGGNLWADLSCIIGGSIGGLIVFALFKIKGENELAKVTQLLVQALTHQQVRGQ